MSINKQKVLRTGDSIVHKKTGETLFIHYLLDENNEQHFELEACKTSFIEASNGGANIFLKTNEANILRRKKCQKIAKTSPCQI